MAETQTLDDDLVEALEVPEGKKERIVWDEELAGFGARALPSGKRTWIVGFRAMGPGGKAGSRRRVIGTPGEMTVEEARLKAREVLEEVAPEEGPDGPQEEPAAGVTAEPDRASEPLRDDVAAEEERSAGAGAETVSAAVTSAGAIQPAGAGELDLDEDLGDLDEMGQGPDAGREPDAVPGEEADDGTTAALAGAIDKVTGAGRTDPYGEVAEAAGRAGQSEMPPVESGSGTVAARVDDGPGGADAAGGHPDGDAADGQGEARDRGGRQEGAGEREAAGSGPGRMGTALKAIFEMAGKVVRGGRTMMAKKAEGSPAREEPAEAARNEPEPGRPASGKAETDGDEGSGEAKLDTRKETTAGVEEKSADGNRLSEDSVAGLAKNLDEMRGVVDRIEAWSEKMGPQMEMLSGSTTVLAGDRRRGRRRWTWAALAMAAMLALGIAGGAVLQSQEPFLPRADPTLGWKDHVWEYYGEAVMGCFQRAKKTESGYADCSLKVRGR